MSETPRTDAELSFRPFSPGVSTDYARKLERELVALRAENERVKDERNSAGKLIRHDWMGKCARLMAELQAARRRIKEVEDYADILAQGLPCLPKDVEVLCAANGQYAERIEYLERELKEAREALKGAMDTCRNSAQYIASTPQWKRWQKALGK